MATKRKTGRGKPVSGGKTASLAGSGKAVAKIIDDYVQRGNPRLKHVAGALRRLVRRTAPQSREIINPWGIPTFALNGPLCFMMVGKNHVTFGFSRGTSLPDPTGLLEGAGKNLRHVKLKDVAQLRDANLRQLILHAAALNRETPLTSSMRVKKTSQPGVALSR
jgi:hypothetical protein